VIEPLDGDPAGQRLSVRALLPSLLVNALAPYVAFQVLTANGTDPTQALQTAAVFPIVGIARGYVRTRRLDVIGLVSLVFILVGLLASLISGDARFILIKESLLTGVFGVVCLGSLLLPRPLMFYFGRQFAGGGDPRRAAGFEARWQYPRFRAVNRTLTVVWGVAYLVEAALRVGLSFVLPIPQFLLVSPVLAIGVTVALISWTMAYTRRNARRAAERLGAVPTGS
jgi:hypothetical protein